MSHITDPERSEEVRRRPNRIERRYAAVTMTASDVRLDDPFTGETFSVATITVTTLVTLVVTPGLTALFAGKSRS